MGRSFKQKLLASLLAAAVALPLGACSKDDGPLGTVTEVTADTPWFNTDKVVVGEDIDKTLYDYVYFNYIGLYNDDYLMLMNAFLKDNGKHDPDFDYSSLQVHLLKAYDREGKETKSIDLDEALKAEGYDPGHVDVDSFEMSGGKIVADLHIMSEDYMSSADYIATFDVDSGKFTGFTKSSDDEDDSDVSGLSYEGSINADGYTVKKYWSSGENTGSKSSYVIKVTDPSGEETSIDLGILYPNEEIYDISTMFNLGDGRVLMAISSSMSFSLKYKLLDLSDYSVTDYKESMSWLNIMDVYQMTYIEGVGYVTKDSDCIKYADFDAGEMKEIINFNNCNINRADLENLTVADMDDDHVILVGPALRDLYGTDMETQIITLTKADSNPNVGKTIIRVAILGNNDYPTSEAICRFNDQNSDYLIQLDNRYTLMNNIDYSSISFNDTADLQSVLYGTMSKLSKNLSMDLMSGEGPDIIIDGYSYPQLDSEDYMIDLSGLLDTSGLFPNVIDAVKTDGKLYQMPTCVGVAGLMTDKELVKDGQVGFTFEEFDSFVKNECNGNTPFTYYNQLDFFTLCMANMGSEFIKDGKVNYNTESFMALARYTKDNVASSSYEDLIGEHNESLFGYSENALSEDTLPVRYCEIASFSNYLEEVLREEGKEQVLLGIPSYKEEGPLLLELSSVGISAETPSRDACIEFVKILLSDDIQEMYGQIGYTPVSQNALRAVSESSVEKYNRNVDANIEGFTDAELHAYGISSVKADVSMAEDYISIINSCKNVNKSDPEIVKILREEIQAYLEGQKSIDDVIDIINDKVQTVIDERG